MLQTNLDTLLFCGHNVISYCRCPNTNPGANLYDNLQL
jgi:hypothetical protein